MRSSKSKAMDQVKQWCGSMKDEDNDRMYSFMIWFKLVFVIFLKIYIYYEHNKNIKIYTFV